MEHQRKRAKKGSTSGKKTEFELYYGQIRNQQNMLQDYLRTGIYQRAILGNDLNFRNKVIMDVGTGSGILAFFAAQAGASKVYAVEASAMADKAQKLLDANGMKGKIDVLHGKMQEVTVPQKVDVIVSEPLGVLLVHERMLETFLYARDNYLKPGGLMMPTDSTISLAPFSDVALYQEQQTKSDFWKSANFFGLDLRPLEVDARQDHFSQPVVGIFDPETLLSTETAKKHFDFQTMAVEELLDFTIPFRIQVTKTALMHGIAGWFDSQFLGGQEQVSLDTSPSHGATHWQQVRLLLQQPLGVNAGQVVIGTLHMVANDSCSYDMKLHVGLEGCKGIESTNRYQLQQQMYHYTPSSAAQLEEQYAQFQATGTTNQPTTQLPPPPATQTK